MADYLYVCQFSNGHVKVGRSINPENRIAQHITRVECVGVSLAQRHVVRCVDNVTRREAALIARCVSACTDRVATEWFSGVAFDDAKRWADECATSDDLRPQSWTSLFDRYGFQSNFCDEHGVSPQTVNNWRRRGIPVEFCARMEAACNGEFTRRDFRPDDWHLIWPELVEPQPLLKAA